MLARRHSMLLAVLLVALAVGLWVAGASPRAAFAGPADVPNGDVLAASPRVKVAVVARTMRVPVPCTVPSSPNARLGMAEVAGASSWHTPPQHRRTPLYTLFRVYRL